MKKTLPVHNEMLAERMEAEKERNQKEKMRKRFAYEAIYALTDTVNEAELLRYLSVLDPSDWCEVVEERFLGRLCGFPLCVRAINVDFRKKHTILRRRSESTGKERKMIVPTESEPVKFCSDRCMGMSRAIAAQLAEQRKQFIIPNHKNQWQAFLTGENMDGAPKEGEAEHFDGPTSATLKPKFGVELVTKLHDLKLADADPNDEKDGEEAEEGLCEDSEGEEKHFLQQINAFVTKKEASISTAGPKSDSISMLGPKEWKRGFLLDPANSAIPPSPDQISTDSKQKEHKKTENTLKCGQQNTKGTPFGGEVIERVVTKYAVKERLKKAERNANKPKVIEAPRISAEQVRQTF